MLIVLEGIDGAGKSTLAQRLPEKLRRAGLGEVELWRKQDHSFGDQWLNFRMAGLRDLIWGDPRSEPEHDTLGTEHYLFLHAAWFAAVHRHRVQPLRSQPDRNAVADGWYYRSVAKAVVRSNVPAEWALSLFEQGRPPDLTVLVDVDPEVAWERRGGNFTPSELGRWDGRTGDPRQAFCSYQSEVRDRLREMAMNRSWIVVRPCPSWTPTEVAEFVYRNMMERLQVSEKMSESVPI